MKPADLLVKVLRSLPLLTAAVFSLAVASSALAATSGPNAGSTFVSNDVGAVDWTNPSNAAASDNSYAQSGLSNGQQLSDQLRGSGFGFAIPVGATIDGIQVSVERSGSTANKIRMNSLQLLKAGSPAGAAYDGSADPYNWPSSDATATYGGSSDLWGTTWTASEINGSGFGVSLVAKHSGVGGSSTAKVDRIAVTVTYTVPTTGTLTVTKVVVGGSAAVGDFPLTLDGLPITSGVATTTSVGLRQVAETSAPNYTASWSGDCNSSGQVTVTGGGSASCTLTNTYSAPTGSLTVNKVVVGGPLDDSEFPLFVDGLPVTDEVATTTVAGIRTVTETSAQHYVATWGESCPGGVVTVPEGGSVTCTLTNTYAPPTTGAIEIVKDVVAPNGGAADDATLFSLTLSGPGDFSSTTSFGEGLAAIFANLAPGDYTVGELAAAGYQLLGISPATTTTVTAGATTTVTVTNRQVATTGTLTVVKVVENNGNPNATAEVPGDFNLYVDGFAVTSGVATTTAAGNRTVTEDAVEGYQASWSEGCEGGVIAVPAEGSATCTLTNTWVGTGFGDVVITKVVVGGELGVEDFALAVGTTTVSSGATTTMAVGEYAVTESSEADDEHYVATFSGDCDEDGNLTVVSDETVTCTITNTYAPPTTGSVTITKNVVASDGETDAEDATLFTVTLTAGEFSTSSTFGEGAPVTFAGLEPGDYAVEEAERSGYRLIGGAATATVVAGEATNVTLTNRQLGTTGTLVIVKNVIAEDGETDVEDGSSFTVTVDGEASYSVAEGSPVTVEIAPGSHTVTEVAQSGYELVSISPSEINVSVEATTTVTVTNRQVTATGEPDEDDGPNRLGRRHNLTRGRVLGASTEGSVLGASTECDPYLTSYIWKNGQNDPDQVTRLQRFLNRALGLSLPEDGVYGAETQAAVGDYQLANWEVILKPWFGDAEPRVPTYNVYKTTRWLINDTECPGVAPFPAL